MGMYSQLSRFSGRNGCSANLLSSLHSKLHAKKPRKIGMRGTSKYPVVVLLDTGGGAREKLFAGGEEIRREKPIDRR